MSFDLDQIDSLIEHAETLDGAVAELNAIARKYQPRNGWCGPVVNNWIDGRREETPCLEPATVEADV